MKILQKEYAKKKKDIRFRLDEFKKVWKNPDKKIFSELCFCICTPQSRAVVCDRAIKGLLKNGNLFNGSYDEIRQGLSGVRFPNNKTGYILEARDLLSSSGKIVIKERIDTKDIIETRDWIVKNIKGIGYKEASHFLRNIGFGEDLAILDVHIIKNMIRYKLVKEKPKTITKKKYFELEEKLRKFSKKINIPLGELDLLFWSSETGEIFK